MNITPHRVANQNKAPISLWVLYEFTSIDRAELTALTVPRSGTRL